MPQYPVLFTVQLLVVALLGVVHVSALSHDLYWHLPWLDVLSHFLGGLWVALALSWLVARFRFTTHPAVLFVLVLSIGVGWEVFEFASGVPREGRWVFDTAIDMCMDALGALVGIYVGPRLA